VKRGQTAAGLPQLRQQHRLSAVSTETLSRLLELLADESAPTAIAPEDALEAHIADSLTGLALRAVREAHTLADLGSGVGFPGLALAAALPAASVVLVESNARRCSWLRQAVEHAELANVSVACARAEQWAEGLGSCDVVTVRALAPLAVVLEYAAPLLRIGGAVVAWKAAPGADEQAAAGAAARELGLSTPEPHAVAPTDRAERRSLYVSTKLEPTPERFPRRPGMAAKRPLGAAVVRREER